MVGARVAHDMLGEFCHRKQMMEDKISVRVTASYDDNNLIYYPVDAYDPP